MQILMYGISFNEDSIVQFLKNIDGVVDNFHIV